MRTIIHIRKEILLLRDAAKWVGGYDPLRSRYIRFPKKDQALIADVLLNGWNGPISPLANLRNLGILSSKESPSYELNFSKPPTSVEVYLELTQGCNFRCPGCASGVDQRQGAVKHLDIETLKRYLTRFFESAQEKQMTQVRLKWAGGEPLLPTVAPEIEAIQPFLRQLSRDYDISVIQAVLTNGSLLTRNMERIKRAGIDHISLRLWGLGAVNAQLRHAPQNTYSQIMSGLGLLHEAGISYNIHHVVTPTNAHHLGTFLSALWNPMDPDFICKDWKRNDCATPIPVGISLFRPQTHSQINYLTQKGYSQMVSGILDALGNVRDFIHKGVPISPLSFFDYLNFEQITPSVCGAGETYVVMGSKGITCCHEKLFTMPDNTSILSNTNLIDLAAHQFGEDKRYRLGCYKAFPPQLSLPEKLVLMLHGGTGCPISIRLENNGKLHPLGSVATQVYLPILNDLLLTELYRIEK